MKTNFRWPIVAMTLFITQFIFGCSFNSPREIVGFAVWEGMCFGSCESTAVSVDKDGLAKLTLIDYDFMRSSSEETPSRSFQTYLAPELFEELKNDLIALRPLSLKETYEADITDTQPIYLRVEYEGEKVVFVTDFRYGATQKLEDFYGKMFDLKNSQNWEEVADEEDDD